jgi:hypothetical protein
MVPFGYVLTGLIAVGILFIGLRFLWAPAAAAAAFGMPNPPSPSAGFNGWLAVKGTRDVVSGLFVFLLMARGSPRLLGEFMLVASLIAFGDMTTVLRAGGSRAAALGIHGLTGLVMVVAGASLIAGAK